MTTGKVVLFTGISIVVKAGLAAMIWILDAFSGVGVLWKILISVIMAADILKDLVMATAIADSNKKNTGKWQWHDRKRTFLGLPLSFTRYRLTTEKLIVSIGFFSTREEEVKLYRVTDLSIKRSFGQKLLGLGTITIHSSDKTDGKLELKNIKRSAAVKELLSKLVEEERDRKRVTGREIIDGHHDPDCDCDTGFDNTDDLI